MIRKYFPGIIFCFLIAGLALVISTLPFFPFTTNNNSHPISSEILAILLGILISNFSILSKQLNDGIDFTVKDILAIAIILLGAKLNLNYLFGSSSKILAIDVMSILINIFIGFWICNKFNLERHIATLLVIGNAICGSSAIIVLAPLIGAHQNQISLSLIISSLLGLIAIFIYPAFGASFGMDNEIFGIWSGSTVQAVPQVLATGFAYSDEAGEIATITKLIKILFLAPAVFLVIYLRKEKQKEAKETTHWRKFIPPFIIGFIIMIFLNSLEIFPKIITDNIGNVTNFLITSTMVGIGLKTNLKSCFNVALKPLAIGTLCCFVISIIMLILTKIII